MICPGCQRMMWYRADGETHYECVYCQYDYFPKSNEWETWQVNKCTIHSNEEFTRRLKMKAFW
jgi:Zn ribbon nucleic-acid-binding protein